MTVKYVRQLKNENMNGNVENDHDQNKKFTEQSGLNMW